MIYPITHLQKHNAWESTLNFYFSFIPLIAYIPRFAFEFMCVLLDEIMLLRRSRHETTKIVNTEIVETQHI